MNDLICILEKVGIMCDVNTCDFKGLQGVHDFHLGLSVNMSSTFIEK